MNSESLGGGQPAGESVARDSGTATSLQEFKAGWRVLLVSVMGVTCGITAVPIYTIGAFVGPLEDAYGWSRGAILSATVFAYLTLIFAGPVAGWLTDRHGPRRVALWSVFSMAAAVASAAVLAGNLWGLYLAYALIGILGAGTSPVVWTRAISSWFVRKRGLAFGITLMGTGLFAAVGPMYVTAAIGEFGWRGGYLALAVVPLVFVLPMVYFWFHERKTPVAAESAVAAVESKQEGLDLSEAMRTPHFWIIGVSFLLFSTSISGFISSYIPMLTDTGLSRETAASMAGVIGISVILGRVVTGFLLDHFPAAILATLLMAFPAVGCLLWGLQITGLPAAATIAAVCVGLAGGGEFDLVAYMTARFFGLRHYGKLYGLLFSSVIAGAVFGPLMFGFGFDSTGSYTPVLLAASSLFLVGGISQLFLLRPPTIVAAPG